jgi:hypothetical protein
MAQSLNTNWIPDFMQKMTEAGVGQKLKLENLNFIHQYLHSCSTVKRENV